MDPNQAGQAEKKAVLQQLVRHALNSNAGKHIQDVIGALKTAIGGYKNFAKEWDNLYGMFNGGSNSNPQVPKQMLAPKAQQPPSMMPQQARPPVTPPPPMPGSNVAAALPTAPQAQNTQYPS